MKPKKMANNNNQAPRTKQKIIRVKCKYRPLHDAYIVEGKISENDADVEFVCSDGLIKAHKIILSSASPFFCQLFMGQEPGMSNVIIPEISSELMRIIITLAYNGKVPKLTAQQVEHVEEIFPIFGVGLDDFECDALEEPVVPSVTQIMNPPEQSQPTNPNPPQNQIPKKLWLTRLQKSQQNGQQESNLIPDRREGLRRRLNTIPIMTKIPGQTTNGDKPGVTRPRIKSARASQNEKMAVANRSQSSQVEGAHPPPNLQTGQKSNPSLGGSQYQFAVLNEELSDSDPLSLDPEITVRKDNEQNSNPIDSGNVVRILEHPIQNAPVANTQQEPQTNDTGNPPYQCSKCNEAFNDENKWNWHENRHLTATPDRYRCMFCHQVLLTAQEILVHEILEHGIFSDDGPPYPLHLPLNSLGDIPADFQIVNGRKIPIPNEISQANPPVHNTTQLEVGEIATGPKRSHGLNKCPLCNAQYISGRSFAMHCLSMHPVYHTKFSYSTLKKSFSCRYCLGEFQLPNQFHAHLSPDGECYVGSGSSTTRQRPNILRRPPPRHDEETNGPPKSKKRRILSSIPISSIASASVTRRNLTTTPQTFTFTPPPPISSPSGSTRLSKRILSGDNGELNFSPVTCPVCGTHGVQKILEHIQTHHSELDVQVSRVGAGLLRCHQCRITFTFQKLPSHLDSCEKMNQFYNSQGAD